MTYVALYIQVLEEVTATVLQNTNNDWEAVPRLLPAGTNLVLTGYRKGVSVCRQCLDIRRFRDRDR
jgi:hypothetical protein